jgi:hypothetical protein
MGQESGSSATHQGLPPEPQGSSNNRRQYEATALLIHEHNMMACMALTLAGYKSDVMKLTLKPAESTRVVTLANSQAPIELLSQAKSHGNIYAATGGGHLTSNDMFKSIALKQQKVLWEKLAKDKKMRE